jgi:hypothetical protein
MRAIQENEMAEPGPQWALGGLRGPRQGESHKVKPTTPGSLSGGVRSSAPAAEDGGEFPGEGPGTARRSPVRPWPPQRPAALRPQAFPSHPAAVFCSFSAEQEGHLAPQPRRVNESLHPTPSSPNESPPPSAAPTPTLPGGAPSSHPAANLLVRVCFFGHFLVHLDACPEAGSFAPFIFLSAHPHFTSPRSPDLVVVVVVGS